MSGDQIRLQGGTRNQSDRSKQRPRDEHGKQIQFDIRMDAGNLISYVDFKAGNILFRRFKLK